MKLEGSCHCGAVRFTMESSAPYPSMRCYCSICRKTGGGGGYAINLMADAATLTVEGEADMAVYQATLDSALSPARRHFCKRCASALWVFDPTWPELIHPFASAIDTPLPTPPETLHIMLDSKAAWTAVPDGDGHRHFPEYPDQSLEDWHRSHGFTRRRRRDPERQLRSCH